MKLPIRRSTSVLSLCVALFFGILVVFLWAFMAHHAKASDEGGILVTVYDRGNETVLLSKEATIGDALKQAGISVEQHDVVEPALDEKMIATSYNVNIYRARPVVVIDGSQRQRLLTAYQTPEQIAADAGIQLHAEDTTQLSRSDDLLSQGMGLELVIDRAVPFEFTLYGKQSTARTQAGTVGEMLKEKNITLGRSDRVSPDVSAPITPGSVVRVWREGKQTVTSEEAVPFPVEQIRDADKPVGFTEVQTPGQDGLRDVTYEINVQDGREVSRTEIASLTTKEPVKQVEIIGTKRPQLTYTGGGSKTDWLAASNIPRDSWGYADFMVQKESGWNPNAINASSGACGLAQALPCSKVPGNPYDPVNSLNWMNGYVNGRYGGWQQAYEFWQVRKWY